MNKRYSTTSISIYFPEDRVCCQYCPLLETYSRNKCRMTFEYIADIRAQGLWCPLEILSVDEEVKNERSYN